MRLTTRLGLAVAVVLAAACKQVTQEITEVQRTAIADTVKAAHRALFASVSTRNTDSVMSFLVADDRLTWVESGMIYPSRDSVVRAVRSFFGGMRAVTVTSAEPKVMVLGRSAAVLTTTFRESFTDTAGATQQVTGAWSAVYHRTPSGWKIVQGHESYPVPMATPAAAPRRRS